MRRLSRTLRLHREPDADTGAVAVLVAILIAGVLLGVGALAVDLGQGWTARVGLRTVAESAALAGAALLPDDPTDPTDPDNPPDLDAVVAAATDVLCADGNRRQGWVDSGVCSPTGRPGATGWATDTNLRNGEIQVVRAEANTVDPDGPSVDEDELPWLVDVITPPVVLDFALAPAIGFDSTNVVARAGARRGLTAPVGRRVADAPFYLTLDDLREADGTDLAICLRTVPVPGPSDLTPPPPTLDAVSGLPVAVLGPVTPTTGTQTSFTLDVEGTTLTGLQVPAGTEDLDLPTDPLTVYVGDPTHPAVTTQFRYRRATGTYEIRVTTPDLAGSPLYGPVPVWFVYDDTAAPLGPTPFVATSTSATVAFPAPPSGTAVRDCDPVRDGRGLVDSRTDGAAAPAGQVEGNVELGLPTTLLPYPARPVVQQLPGREVTCEDAGGEPLPETDDPAARQASCVRTVPAGQVPPAALTTGWIGDPAGTNGRLRRTCTGDVRTMRPSTRFGPVPNPWAAWQGDFDTTRLFSTTNGMVRDGADLTELASRVQRGQPATEDLRGVVNPLAFDCPRLLLVPVLDTARPPQTDGRYPVVALTYFWVSDTQSSGRPRPLRGLLTDSAGAVVGIRGWVVDPAYVRGGDWQPSMADPDDPGTVLPMALPRRAVLSRTPCDDHPDTTPCNAPTSP